MTTLPIRPIFLVIALAVATGLPAAAQQTRVAFGSDTHDASLPVEIESDSFTLRQSEGTAEFLGNVVVGQGGLRLAAGKIVVRYSGAGDASAGEIESLTASDGVTLVSGTETAEADKAEFVLASNTIEMTGDVLLTQGNNALSGQIIVISLADGSAVISGRVKTIFTPDSSN